MSTVVNKRSVYRKACLRAPCLLHITDFDEKSLKCDAETPTSMSGYNKIGPCTVVQAS